MTKNPARGLGFLIQGFRLLAQPGVRPFVIIPFLINASLFAAVIVYGGRYFMDFLEHLLPDWLDWLSWLVVPLFALTMLIVTFYSFTMVANLLSAPFNSLLSEKVEMVLTGARPNVPAGDGWGGIARDVGRSFRSELRKLGYFLVRAAPLLLLFLVPGLNLAAPFLWAAFSAWFLSLEYGDYPLGNRGLRFSEQKRQQSLRRWEAFGFGAGVLAMTLIPVLNFLAMPVGVAGATAMWVKGGTGAGSIESEGS